MTGLVAKLFDFTLGVHAFERRQVDHVQDHFQARHFSFFLDASRLKPTRTLDHTDLIDGGRVGAKVSIGGSHKVSVIIDWKSSRAIQFNMLSISI
jgi:hypothetical protein